MPAAGAVAAILVIIGSVMPWASVTTPFGTVSAAGTEGDGKLTLIAGLLLLGGAVASAVVRQRWMRIAQLVVAALTTILAVYELIDISGSAADLDAGFAEASVGAGVYVVLVGAIAATVVALLQMRRSQS